MSTIVAIFRRMVRIPAIPFSFAAVAAPFVQVSASAPGARIHLYVPASLPSTTREYY